MNDILFIDIETNQKGKIVDYGALFGEQELHEQHPARLEKWINEAKIICGHNIIRHDVPELKKTLGEEIFQGKELLDTLIWSPLIFAENPYHHLVKGYKIVNDSEANNPLSDCKLTKELLLDELNAFDKFDEGFKSVLRFLLSSNKDFAPFLRLLPDVPYKSMDLEKIKDLVSNRICSSADLDYLVRNYPVELAYSLSLIRVDNNESILPYWVRHEYPECDQVLDKLRFSLCSDPECEYCRSKFNPQTALLNYFGFKDFRKFDHNREISLQEETVRAGLQEHSFVAVFPTGGGKSLTFQLPALMRGDCTGHLTVVVSPLVSLMKDQVDNLQDRFHITKAVAINGLLSPLERQEAIDRVEKGGAHILYVSPESLRSPTIFRVISSRAVARFVIDEAHCFSSWGQDFRVDYLYIAEFIKKLQAGNRNRMIPVSCFTATAKPQVIEDIKKYFQSRLGLELKEFITQKGRTNLSYEVIDVEDPASKMNYLLPLLKECEKPAIVYASRTKVVEKVSGLVNEAGISCTHFHGQMEKDQKKENMDSFMSGGVDVVVATSAFGMGVDKEDVRTVIHYNISDSLENYIQEAGRAGRKESIQAKCYILFNESDLNKHFSLLQQTKINKKEIEEIWKSLKSQAKFRPKISRSALEIAKHAGWDTEIRELETRVTTAISALEDRGFLVRDQNSPQVFADSLMVSSFARGQYIILNSQKISDKDKEDCIRILKRIITDEEARIDYLADRTELSINRVQNAIRMLRDLKILGDAKDLTAFVNLNNSKYGSINVVKRFLHIEKNLLKGISSKKKLRISIRQLNQNLLDLGDDDSTTEAILRILNYWEIRRFISKKRTDREKEIYEIVIKKGDELEEDVKWRHDLTGSTIEKLVELAKDQDDSNKPKEEMPVTFSLLELRDSIGFMGKTKEENTKRYELVLLFLNQIKSIKLEGGFMVSYNKLKIEDIKAKEKPHYKVEDYAKMDAHYQHKTEQIHIVGEYAKKCIQNYEGALTYVNDYFTLEYEEFLAQYFPGRKSEIRRPLTADRFKEIMQDLETEQANVLRDNKSNNILVLAGPGAGKTKVLVHKIASLLLLEEIKPEQFLMLTFSKAASLEFRFRTRKLVPEFAGLVKITTFHGFCFELLGQLGDLQKSKNVIADTVKGIEDGDIDTTLISNKNVLLLDEVQDINQDEWNLIQSIIKVAGNIRVIAVGDDDQNIYNFRGSSNQYMKYFKDKYNTTVYSLIKNHRSRSGIIRFNNQILTTITGRLKSSELVPAKRTLKAKIELVKYPGKHLVEPLVKAIAKSGTEGTKAVLVRTNYEALIVSSLLEELGHKTRLLAGFEGFSMALLVEVRWMTNLLKSKVNESGLIYENYWEDALNEFKGMYSATQHYLTCTEIFKQFDLAYPDKKLLVDWYEYIREIKMEDAIHPDSTSIIVSTMHKAKGKEFNHVWLLNEDYDFSTNEAKRLIYVACSRAKDSLHIHTNSSFFNHFSGEDVRTTQYDKETFAPMYYELILNHKEINLNSQKYPRALNIIKNLITGDELVKDTMVFGNDEVPGLAISGGGNMLLFSKEFIEKKYEPFIARGYELVNANVEYMVHWYDRKEDKEYRIVLPRLRFERTNSE